jgi:hypothetical protein
MREIRRPTGTLFSMSTKAEIVAIHIHNSADKQQRHQRPEAADVLSVMAQAERQ